MPHSGRAFKRLFRQFLVSSLSAILVLQQTVALAAGAVPLRADTNAPVANQPGIAAAPNGVPLVNIVTPNGAGLSHNKYSDFNVGTPGLILNNTNQEISRSQLGGLVPGNKNLANSGPAAVILNEVTGSSRSALEGAIEVNGAAANVIIANQNGLTCNGCGFVNAPRVTLSTGTPVIGADGTLSSLIVNGGDILVDVNGANATAVNVFDLISRTISVKGPVAAGGDLNLTAGRNSVAYQGGQSTPLGADGNEPGIAIDSSALGGMYAGRINLLSSDKGAGVNMAGPMVANTGGATLTADGHLTLGQVQASGGAITARSVSDAVSVASTLYSDTAIVLQGQSGIDLADKALVASAGDVTLTGQTITLGQGAIAASGTDVNGQQTATGTLSVQATTLDAGNGLLAGGALLSIEAGNINLARPSDTGQDTLRSLGDMVIVTDQITGTNALVTAGADLTVRSGNALTLDGGNYLAGNNLQVTAASLANSASLGALNGASARTTGGNLTNTGAIAGNLTTTVASAADLGNTGGITSVGDVTVSAGGNLGNAGTIAAAGAAAVTVGGNLGNAGAGLVAAGGDLTITAATLGNDGTIAAAQNGQGTLSVTTSGNLTNTGTLLSMASAAITSSGNLANSGEIGTGGDLGIAVKGALDVTDTGQLLSQGVMTLTGLNGGAMGSLTVGTDALINGGAALGIQSASLTNAGQIGSVNGMLLAEIAGDITNTGVLYSGTSSVYLLDGTFTNTADVIAGTDLTIQGLSGVYATALTNTSGTIQSGGDMTLGANTITNQRDGGLTVTTTSNTTTSTVGPVQVDSMTQRTTTTTVTTTDEQATLAGVAGQLLAGGNMLIDTGASGTLTNNYSQIAANADLTINAGTVTNEGRDLIETISTTTVEITDIKHCGMTAGGICWPETHEIIPGAPVNTTTTSTIGSVYATIQAGGNLVANVGGYVDNNAVRGQAGQQVGLYSGNGLSGVTVTGPASSLASVQTTVTSLLGRQAMFSQPADPNAPYLIETRSAFIDLSLYLSSDYFLNLIGYDPDHTLKRLGDAYVEYQVVEKQIYDLTGRRALTGGDPVAQMQALYDNAVDEQQHLGLVPGVALTPTQIAGLTKDIVWLEQQTINGAQVLVPRVYLSASTLANTNPASAQIQAGGVGIISTGKLINSGAITTGGGLGVQTTGDVVNTGGGLYSAGDIVVQAGGNVANRSGVVAGNNVAITAGGNISNDTLSVRDTYGSAPGTGPGGQPLTSISKPSIAAGGGTPLPGMSSADNYGDRQQQTGVISAQGSLLVQAAGDVTAQGGQFVSGGDMTLVAGNDITLNPLTLNSASRITVDGGFARSANTTNIGAVLYSGGDMTLAAGNDLNATAAQASAGGLLTVVASRDIKLAAGTDQSILETQSTSAEDYFVGSSTTVTYDYRNATTSVPTSFTGGSVYMGAGRDIALAGSSVTGQGDVAVQAGGNINLASTIDTSIVTHNSETTSSGFMAAPTTGTWGFAIGSRDVRDQSTTTTLSNMASLVGSVGGGVSVQANGDFTSNASVLMAPGGDLTVVANSISIAAGIDSSTTQTSHDDHFSGLIVTVGGGPGSPLKNVQQVMNFERAAGKTKDPRAQTLYEIAEAGQAVNAVYTLATKGLDSLLSVQATIGYGVNDSHSQSTSYAQQATATQYNAGGTAMLEATGSDLTLRGVSLQANDVRLSAANDVDLLSLAVNSGYDASSSSSSSLIGITVSTGLQSGGVGVGVTARMSQSQSQSHDEKTSYVPTVVTGTDSVTIDSGRDTSLLGAQVYGGKIDVTVARNLTIVSDQNTETQTASQSSWSVGGTLGVNAANLPYGSFSASESSGKASGNYISVVNQAGLYAGDGGFNVNVGGVTTLTGAALASTADASLNSLSTGALVTSDLQNSSDWSAKTSGYGFSLGMSGSKPGIGGLQPSLPQNESGSSSGTAVASIAPGTINILDPATQKMLTGMTPDQAVAAVDRAAAAQNKAADTLPNLSQTLQNQAARNAAFAAASSTTANLVGTFATVMKNDADNTVNTLTAKLKTNGSLTPEQQQQLADAQAASAAWGEGGAARVLLHGITQGVLAAIGGGTAAGWQGGLGAAAAAALGPEIANAVNQSLKDAGLGDGGKSTLGNLVAELITTGIGAAVGGGAGAATAASVQINNFLGFHPSKKPALQKQLDDCNDQPGSCAQKLIASLKQQIEDSDSLGVNLTKVRTLNKQISDCQGGLPSGACSDATLQGLQKHLNLIYAKNELIYASSAAELLKACDEDMGGSACTKGKEGLKEYAENWVIQDEVRGKPHGLLSLLVGARLDINTQALVDLLITEDSLRRSGQTFAEAFEEAKVTAGKKFRVAKVAAGVVAWGATEALAGAFAAADIPAATIASGARVTGAIGEAGAVAEAFLSNPIGFCTANPYSCVAASNFVGDAILCIETNTCGTLTTPPLPSGNAAVALPSTITANVTGVLAESHGAWILSEPTGLLGGLSDLSQIGDLVTISGANPRLVGRWPYDGWTASVSLENLSNLSEIGDLANISGAGTRLGGRVPSLPAAADSAIVLEMGENGQYVARPVVSKSGVPALTIEESPVSELGKPLSKNIALPSGEVIPKGSIIVSVIDDTMTVVYPNGTTVKVKYSQAMAAPQALPPAQPLPQGYSYDEFGRVVGPSGGIMKRVGTLNGDQVFMRIDGDGNDTRSFLAVGSNGNQRSLTVADLANVNLYDRNILSPRQQSSVAGFNAQDWAIQAVSGRINLAEVWQLVGTDRGNAIEAYLARTDYSSWYNIGQSYNGTWKSVDFQLGLDAISLKTVDTTGSGWLNRMQEHIDKLAEDPMYIVDPNNSANHIKANMALDLRVQPGGAAAAQSLVQYGAAKGIPVYIKEFP